MNATKRALLSLLIVSSTISLTSAFWGTGHLLGNSYLIFLNLSTIVARIAYDKLLADNPAYITRANTILSHLASFTTLEKDYPFVECATFADDIKSKGWAD